MLRLEMAIVVSVHKFDVMSIFFCYFIDIFCSILVKCSCVVLNFQHMPMVYLLHYLFFILLIGLARRERKDQSFFESSWHLPKCLSVYRTRWRLHIVPLIPERKVGKL